MIQLIKKCKICGKVFETKGNRTICYDKHTRICEVCGKEFELKWPYNQKICDNYECRTQNTRLKATAKPKICQICGKTFYPTSPRQKYCTEKHLHICCVCGKEFTYTYQIRKRKTCGSKKCIERLREYTLVENFGVANAMQSEELKQNYIDSMQMSYGVNWPAQSSEIKKRMEESIESKYGSRSALQVPMFHDKFTSTMHERYNGDYTMSSTELHSKVVSTMKEKYGVPYFCMTEDYQRYQRNHISKINKKFSELLKQAGIQHTLEKSVENRQYDICIEDRKILIELDPTITHNSYFSIYDAHSTGLDMDYHFNKSSLAEKHGYRCIHIFDWDDWSKIVDILKIPTMKYFARNLTLSCVSFQSCKQFEIENHLQNSCNNQIIRLGLYSGDKLIQIMTFGKSRYNSKFEYELLRLCTLNSCVVIGGAKKLFYYFIQQYKPKSIISYCDKSKFSGDIYQHLGMSLQYVTPPAKIWSKGKTKITDNLLRSRGFDQLFKTNYGKGTSNEALMLQEKWLPIYDCGQNVFTWNR